MLDIAVDSSFNVFVSGLQNWWVNPLYKRYKQIGSTHELSIYTLPQDVRYYARLRAWSAGGFSLYSEVQSSVTQNPSTVFNSPIVLPVLLSIASISPTNFAVKGQMTSPSDVTTLSIHNMECTGILPNQLVQKNFDKTFFEDTIRGLPQPNNILPYRAFISTQAQFFNQIALHTALLPELWQYLERVENLEYYELPWQQGDTTLYVYDQSLRDNPVVGISPDLSVNQTNVDSLLLRLAAAKLPIETVWYQNGYAWYTPTPLETRQYGVDFRLAVKLRQTNDRIKQLGPWKRVTELAQPWFWYWEKGVNIIPIAGGCNNVYYRRYIFRSMPTDVKESPAPILTFAIAPNPMSEQATVTYTVPERAQVTVRFYDMMGRQAIELVNDVKEPGTYSLPLNMTMVSSGVYVAELLWCTANGHAQRHHKVVHCVK